VSSQRIGFTLLNLLLCLGMAVGLASAQNEQAPSKPTDERAAGRNTSKGQTPAPSRAVPDDYVIGPEDMLAIVVWKEQEVSRTLPVRPDGKISLPLVGDLQASGHTPAQLRSLITEKLKAYITSPEVAVIVQEVRSRKFNIVGQIAKPGSYLLADKVTILDAIAMAGGFQQFAKANKIYVLRRGRNGSQLKLPFNYKDVIKGKRSDENVELLPDDTVVVP
jgi:polysaccharide biosynthesis/export protein